MPNLEQTSWKQTLRDHLASAAIGPLSFITILTGMAVALAGFAGMAIGFSAGTFAGAVAGVVGIGLMATGPLVATGGHFFLPPLIEKIFSPKEVNFKSLTMLSSFVLSLAGVIQVQRSAEDKLGDLYQQSKQSCPTALAPSAKPSFFAAATGACQNAPRQTGMTPAPTPGPGN